MTSPPLEPVPPPRAEAPIKLTPEPESRADQVMPGPGVSRPAAPVGASLPPRRAVAAPENQTAPAGGERHGAAVDRLVNVPTRDRSVVDSQNIPDPTIPTMAEADALDAGLGRERRGVHPAIPFLVAILLIVGVLVGLIVMKRKGPDAGPLVVPDKPAAPAGADVPAGAGEEDRTEFLRSGWREASSGTMSAFLRATTPEEKVRHVIGGEARLGDLQAFYGGEKIDESDTPIELFSHFDLDIADKKRGLFMMQYDRPSQFDMREFFRPVATLEVENELEPPGQLLSAFASRQNFAMEPMRVMAFFKEEGGRLLLDWDVYAQTKYRTLRTFMGRPRAGHSEVFRIMTREELPASTGIDVTKERYFRFSDPAHAQDFAQVPVAVDSEAGRILADLAWINIPGKQAQDRYATVELAWSEDSEPQLILKRLLCWEFLGLGGVEGNADPVEESPGENPSDPDPLGTDPVAPAPPNPALEPVGLPGPPAEEETGPLLPGENPGAPAAGTDPAKTP